VPAPDHSQAPQADCRSPRGNRRSRWPTSPGDLAAAHASHDHAGSLRPLQDPSPYDSQPSHGWPRPSPGLKRSPAGG